MRMPCPRFLIMIAIAGLSGRAAAQPAPAPTAAELEQARRYAQSGIEAQDAGDYDTAIENYRKAYRVVANALLLFDMAQAYRLAGKDDLAIDYYRRYLADPEPEQSKVPAARVLLAELQAGSPGSVRPPGAQAATSPPVSDRAAGPAVPSSATAFAPPPGLTGTADTPEPGNPSQGQSLRRAGIATMGAGAVSLAIGVGYAFHGRSLSDEVSTHYDPSKDSAGSRANIIQVTGLVAGTALVAIGGAIWWWAGRRSGGAAQVSVVPTVSGHMAGLAISSDL